MDGKLILGIINYLFLGLIFLFSLIAILFKNQKRKITFLFLVFLCLLVISFLFFSNNGFMLSAIIIVVFCVLLILFINNQEYYGIKTVLREKSNKDAFLAKAGPLENISKDRKQNQKNKVYFIISLIIGGLLAFIFFSFTKNFYNELKYVETFNTVSFITLINEICTGFNGLIFLILLSLFGIFYWSIYMIENRKESN